MVQWLKLSLPMQRVQVQALVGEPRSHMPQGQNTKAENRNNSVTNSIKTLKMVPIKNINILKKKKRRGRFKDTEENKRWRQKWE